MKYFVLSLMLAASAAAIPGPAFKPINRLPGIKSNPFRRANQLIPVVVGGPQVTFTPNIVQASVGDIIQFQFANGNHTVTESTGDAACTPKQGGVHSGHIPFADGQADVGTFNMPVTTTGPMFLYCATGPHCQLGQVMIVNPADSQQLANYAKASQISGKSVDGGAVTGGSTGRIALGAAAFVPAPPKAAAAPPPAAPPAAPAAPPAASSAAPAPPAAAAPAASSAAPAPPAAAPPATSSAVASPAASSAAPAPAPPAQA